MVQMKAGTGNSGNFLFQLYIPHGSDESFVTTLVRRFRSHAFISHMVQMKVFQR